MSSVPVIITWDIDPLSRDELIRERLDSTKSGEELLKNAILSAVNLIEEFELETTFFITASAANLIQKELSVCLKLGSEIGNHGLTHGLEELYDEMPFAKQHAYIKKSTELLENLLKTKVTAFRAPRVKLSPSTMRVLEKLHYTVDSSICSFRIDFISSSISMPRAIFAPRTPYHPSFANPFEKGDMKILEVPVSAYIVPFISATLDIFGLKFMKKLFKKLYNHSVATGAPIVYLCHPTQFFANADKAIPIPAEWFRPSKEWLAEGLPFRHFLFRTNGMKMLENTKELFAHISAFSKIEFVSLKNYVSTQE